MVYIRINRKSYKFLKTFLGQLIRESLAFIVVDQVIDLIIVNFSLKN